MRGVSCAAVWCLLVLAGVTLVAAIIKVNPDTKFFVAEDGRTLLFHGVNVVYKVPPYIPITTEFHPTESLSAKDMDDMQRWGWNSVRLGIMWPGVEPTEGMYNKTYMAMMVDIVNQLGARGIYSILDFHQDTYSPYFCGEGIPDFVVQKGRKPFLPFAQPLYKDAFPTDSHGYPRLEECIKNSFFKYYFTSAVSSAFQDLYDDYNGIQKLFLMFWQEIAFNFAGNPYVLGYELFNEPWAGDIYRDPLLMAEMGRADRKNLIPLYTKLQSLLRAIDNDHIFFFEPAVSDYWNSGFTEGPGGPAYNDRQAYSYHIYCSMLDRHGDPKYFPFCDQDQNMIIARRVEDYQRIGVAGFLTEFGADSNETAGIADVDFIADAADNLLQSWSYWQFKAYRDPTTSNPEESEGLYMPNGDLQVNKLRALSRTYPQATAGIPLKISYEALNGSFFYQFAANTSISNPTEIYVNEDLVYPHGLTVSVQPAAKATYEYTAGSHRVYVRCPAPQCATGEVVTVTIEGQPAAAAVVA